MSATKRAVGSVFILHVLFAIVSLGYGNDWPRWRGPNGDGISTETDWDPQAITRGPKILWKTKVGMSLSSVAIQGKYLYTMGGNLSNDSVLCLNIENGKTIWQYTYECRKKARGPQTTPAIDGEYIYTLSTEGHLYCFNARKGKVKWYKHIEKEYDVKLPFYEFAGSPVIEGNLLILTGNTNGIALEKISGKMVWNSSPGEFIPDPGVTEWPGSVYATPVLYTRNGHRYAAIYNKHGLNSVDAETGKPNWFQPWNVRAEYVADPIIFDGKAFISTFQNHFECALLDINSENPKVLWRNMNMGNDISTCVLIDGYLYGCHGSAGSGVGVLRCLDVKNGKVMWEKDLGGTVSLTAADKKLLLLTGKGKLHIAEASPKAYIEISSAQIFEQKGAMKVQCWVPPVLCGGRIYCKSNIGELVCIDVRN